MNGTPWSAAELDLLVATHRTHTVAQQTALLPGRSAHAVRYKRQELIAAGRISPTARAAARAWSADDEATFLELLGDGRSVSEIARALKRSAKAVYCLCRRRGIAIERRRRDGVIKVRTLVDVQRLFDAHWSVVRRWINQGWLPARSSRLKRANVRKVGTKGADLLISDVDLQAFLAVEEAWPSYDPARITDPDWRGAAEDARRGREPWVRIIQIAAELGYDDDTVRRVVRRAGLPATKIAGAWYLRQSAAQQLRALLRARSAGKAA